MKTYTYPPGEGKVRWISTDWLSQHIDDDDLMLLDVQPNVHDYIMGHLPGAIYLNEGLLRGAWAGLPAVYVAPECIGPILGRAGLDPLRPVVIYTGAGRYSRCTAGLGDGLEQTMMAYSLVRFGHCKVLILDGGLEKWKEEGHELTKVFPKWEPTDFRAEVQREFFIEYEEFKQMVGRNDVMVFDARPAEFYEEGGLWIKRGHIPGALSLPWRSLMAKDNPKLLKTEEELSEILGKFDIISEKKLIVYCGTGREATNEFLFFKYYLGHKNVRIYEGSFTEWTAHPENPTVTGKNPK
ncbi:MAG TPA: rhodanese-like domain-containing protein [Methanothrix sp.]|nr:rhodanese-like domain-containing protein [Methanothrix sp.]